jgi:drug/metabolite transporter (DMT)-like permease
VISERQRLFTLTLVAMVAFATNSLLCRAALRDTAIDAASFTFIRIFAGAVALWLIVRSRSVVATAYHRRNDSSAARLDSAQDRRRAPLQGDWISAFALFVYAAAFSFAYKTLSAGTGALLLFGAVQATMIFWGLRKGERLDMIQIVGLLVAIVGLIVLVFPGLSAPPLIGSVLMLGAGLAWGVYSLRGQNASDAIASTAVNFLRATVFGVLLSALMLRWARVDSLGVIYAVISGAVTSGLGYVLWYSALPALKAIAAATVQLSAPVLAAAGGILVLSEPITLRYFIAAVAVLGGIFLVVIERRRGA